MKKLFVAIRKKVYEVPRSETLETFLTRRGWRNKRYTAFEDDEDGGSITIVDETAWDAPGSWRYAFSKARRFFQLPMAVRRLYTERPGVVADSTPPQGLSFLFYFLLDADHCDAVVGDLEERYKLIFGKFGKNKADLWYWKETIRTIGPIAWSWFKKLVMKPAMAVLGWMVAHGLVKDGTLVDWLVEVVKRIRG